MKYMECACKSARIGINNNEGGPFGAVIVDNEGNIISSGNNKVLKNNDPTAHAEIVAIREACKNLETYNLEGYKLYTTCEPCPMCLSAIIWANIKEVYYGASRSDVEKIGFKDSMIYDYFKGEHKELVLLNKMELEDCKNIVVEYEKNNNSSCGSCSGFGCVRIRKCHYKNCQKRWWRNRENRKITKASRWCYACCNSCKRN